MDTLQELAERARSTADQRKLRPASGPGIPRPKASEAACRDAIEVLQMCSGLVTLRTIAEEVGMTHAWAICVAKRARRGILSDPVAQTFRIGAERAMTKLLAGNGPASTTEEA